MELYEKQLAEAARKAAAEHMAALYSDMDRMLCEDISRAEKYTIQRHDKRQLLTTVGPVCFTHTLFRSRKDGTCHYLLDEWMELDAHERLSSRAEEEVKKALAAGVPKATILTYFYPEVTVEKMSSYRKKQL